MTALHIITSYLLFVITTSIVFYIPGLILLSCFKNSFSAIEKFVLSWGIGYSCFIFLGYIGSWIHIAYLPLLVFLLTGYGIFYKRSFLKLSFEKVDWRVMSILIVGSFAMTSMSFLSGLVTSHGLQFVTNDNSTDAVMHVARIKTQMYLFPPVYTGFFGYVMHGYHYFYDFLLSRFAVFFLFTPEDLYYRLFPLFISLLYGGAIYLFSTRFTKKATDKLWILFFAYFAQSFGFLLSLFTKKIDIANGLGLVQPQQLILDPSIIFAIALLLLGSYVLLDKKITGGNAIISGLLLGLLAQLKVYGGIIALGMLVVLILYRLVIKREIKWHIVTFGIAFLLTALTYFPNNLGVGKLIFSPFFIYTAFIKQNSIFNSWNWDIRMIIYTAHHNIPRILLMYTEAFILFWILTLGSRIIIIGKSLVLLKKNFWTNEQNVLLILLIIIPLGVASIFVQSISIFDTVQFLWLVGILLCIPAGIFYGQLTEKFPKWGKGLLIAGVIFLSLGSFIANEYTYIIYPIFITVPTRQMEVVKTIQKTVPRVSYFVVAPAFVVNKDGIKEFYYYGAPLLADLTGIRTYYEYEVPVFPDEKKVDVRKRQVEQITLSTRKCDGISVLHIMKQIGTQYLLTESENSCKNISHMQKIAKGNNWTFWIVK